MREVAGEAAVVESRVRRRPRLAVGRTRGVVVAFHAQRLSRGREEFLGGRTVHRVAGAALPLRHRAVADQFLPVPLGREGVVAIGADLGSGLREQPRGIGDVRQVTGGAPVVDRRVRHRPRLAGLVLRRVCVAEQAELDARRRQQFLSRSAVGAVATGAVSLRDRAVHSLLATCGEVVVAAEAEVALLRGRHCLIERP